MPDKQLEAASDSSLFYTYRAFLPVGLRDSYFRRYCRRMEYDGFWHKTRSQLSLYNDFDKPALTKPGKSDRFLLKIGPYNRLLQ